MTRRSIVLGSAVVLAWMIGCSGSSPNDEGQPEPAKLGLPLQTQAASGASYTLRQADFQIWGYRYACGDQCEYEYSNVVSSEDYLDESSIVLDLIAGDYEIYLRDGWRLERTNEDGEVEVVDAVLLSSNTQWVYLSPHSTSWVSFQFGVGDIEVWLNGQLNIDIDVYEDPDEYYYPGVGGGWVTGGAGGIGGSPIHAGGMVSGIGGGGASG